MTPPTPLNPNDELGLGGRIGIAPFLPPATTYPSLGTNGFASGDVIGTALDIVVVGRGGKPDASSAAAAVVEEDDTIRWAMVDSKSYPCLCKATSTSCVLRPVKIEQSRSIGVIPACEYSSPITPDAA